MQVLLTDLQLNVRMLSFKKNDSLWLLFYIKTFFHAVILVIILHIGLHA